MTNEEREALIAQGWTPPVAVDPDLAEAERLWLEGFTERNLALAGIKRGRALAAAEAKTGMVWIKHDGSEACPVSVAEEVLIQYSGGQRSHKVMASMISWGNVTHYAIITQPEEK